MYVKFFLKDERFIIIIFDNSQLKVKNGPFAGFTLNLCINSRHEKSREPREPGLQTFL